MTGVEGVPSGIISMWSGSFATIPSGWNLCDGTNGTPDLRNRFIYGANVTGDVGATGGSANAIVVSHTHSTPNHTHTGSAATTSLTGQFSFTDNNSTSMGVRVRGTSGNFSSVNATRSNLNSSGVPGAANVPGDVKLNGNHSHSVTVNSGGGGTTGSNGSSGTNANLPPYMKLAYIMKS